ncbi:DUF2238 domain-containing protein [Vibrio sp. SCSIO 43135]|uniref:DUF2238 domain-containing protein n=1 Tax=Vibrio paucivorans TaxID=2829489 RepID=A0A9X3CFP1_9VIBR|nr:MULTISPECIES: DUF2238 domain-containing protein [Vibrio]MCW8334882.1 DUF2238 domain-containing protein [Vibrio paucivorans]USD43955.1 DUF2238 domain-containing protein [Vibrio sp. SCSIO 43135]
MSSNSNRLTFNVLLLFYTAVFLFSAISPASRAVWIAEIIPAVAILGVIAWVSTKVEFSKTALVMMFIWLCLHTIGAKYTFAEVPFDWFNHVIGSERNNFDRVAHFSIGLYAYPIAEVLIKKKVAKPVFASLFGLFAIMSVAAAYEIIEWWYAAIAGGDEGIAFLGSQGDIWDAQKDMLCDTTGALVALLIMRVQRSTDWYCSESSLSKG